MAQLWIENKRFQVRVVTDSNSNKEAPGILAKSEINLELKSDWNQVMFSVEEQNSALKNHLAFKVIVQINGTTKEEHVIEFPQLFKKNLKSLSFEWFFGDGRYPDECIDHYQLSSCKIFKGSIQSDGLTALCLLGPSGKTKVNDRIYLLH